MKDSNFERIYSIDDTFIGIFTPIKNILKGNNPKQKKYVTVKIPTWQIVKDMNILEFSKYGFTAKNNYLLSSELDIMNFPDDKWLLCPIQLKKYEPKWSFEDNTKWDIQVGISGKCKNLQSPPEAMMLELEEELGLKYIGNPIGSILTKHQGSWWDEKNKVLREYMYDRTTFKISIKSTRQINADSDKPIQTKTDEENYYNTIACLVYGSFEDIKTVLETKKINYSSNEDRIIGMAYVSGKTIKKHIARILNE